MQVEIRNLAAVNKQIDTWLGDRMEQARRVAIGLAMEMTHQLAKNSPQYSGDFAGNWKLSVGSPDYRFDDGLFPSAAYSRSKKEESNPFIMGALPAINETMRNARMSLSSTGFALGETIYISNNAYHDEPYAVLIEQGKIRFRDGNVGHPVKRSVDMMNMKYGKNISRTQLGKLYRWV